MNHSHLRDNCNFEIDTQADRKNANLSQTYYFLVIPTVFDCKHQEANERIKGEGPE